MSRIEGMAAARGAPRPEAEATTCKGLCETCIYAVDCTFPRNPDQPVLFCEEFEANPLPSLETDYEVGLKITAANLNHVAEGDPGKLRGLCVNCAHRQSCQFPIPEGGIWHCEEYE